MSSRFRLSHQNKRVPMRLFQSICLSLFCVVVLTSNALAQTPTINTIAGNGTVGYTGDGGQATAAQINAHGGVAVDSAGNLYFADLSARSVVRKVTPAGIITTVAGNGSSGFSGDGIHATSAQLNVPRGMAVDFLGNLYIADSGNNRIRKVSGGVITTVAGNGSAGFAGDGGSATNALLNSPRGVAVDASGNLFIADV